jgi:protein-L-isoaspartate(D-aspartate) O-methyltransferase
VLGIEVDPELAAAARGNLADLPWVEIRHGNGADPLHEGFDAMLINAGVTHPLAAWLDALVPGGRMIVPLTATMPPMTAIGKGPMLFLSRTDDPVRLTARFAGFVAIYSALGLRDEAVNTLLGQALQKNPFAPVKSLRRDAHEADATCWVHRPGCCLSLS